MFRSHLYLKPSPIIKREIKLDAAVGEGGGVVNSKQVDFYLF